MADGKLKAYRVYEKSEDTDDGMGIVFAVSPTEARQKAWGGELDINADSYTDLRARREHWADAYAETQNIPIRAYPENHWYWTCYGIRCSTFVGIDNIGGMEDGEPLCERCAKERGLSRPEWASPLTEAAL